MANSATSIVPLQVTVTATSAAVSRGKRVTLNGSGLVAASAIGVRGDYITLQDISASGVGLAVPVGAGGHVPVVASESVAVGDAAYSAASGNVSKTSTNAVLIGKWIRAASANALGVVELSPIA